MKNLLIKKRALIITLVVVFIVGLYGYRYFSGLKTTEYVFEKAVKGTVVKEVVETGSVRASDELKLSFENSGKIDNISVNKGDIVKAGQELASLDISDLKIQLAEAEAALDVSAAQKGDAEVSLGSAEQTLIDVKTTAEKDIKNAYEDGQDAISDAYLKIYDVYSLIIEVQNNYFSTFDANGGVVIERRNSIEHALALAKNYDDAVKKNSAPELIDSTLLKIKELTGSVRDSLETVRDMVKSSSYRDLVSSTYKTSLDTQKTNINTSYSNIVSAQQAIGDAKVSGDKKINDANADVIKYKSQLNSGTDGLYNAQLDQARAKVSLLKNQIENASIKSPVDGRITDIVGKVGELAYVNEPVIYMLSSGPFEVKVDIYEEDIVDVKVGDTVKVDLIAFPDQPLTGKVISIDPAEKLIDGIVYYEVKISLDEPKEGVRNGMTADVAILVGKKDSVLMVPKIAVEKLNGEKVVQVLVNGKPQQRSVKTGLEGNDFVEILSGLNEGESVVTSKNI